MKFALIVADMRGTIPVEKRVAVVDADSYEEAESYARRRHQNAIVEEVEDSMPATVVVSGFHRSAVAG